MYIIFGNVHIFWKCSISLDFRTTENYCFSILKFKINRKKWTKIEGLEQCVCQR